VAAAGRRADLIAARLANHAVRLLTAGAGRLMLAIDDILPPFEKRPFSPQTSNCSSPTFGGQSRLGKVDPIYQGRTH
jgi:hypothetical protein